MEKTIHKDSLGSEDSSSESDSSEDNIIEINEVKPFKVGVFNINPDAKNFSNENYEAHREDIKRNPEEFSNPLSCFELFFTPECIDIMVDQCITLVFIMILC